MDLETPPVRDAPCDPRWARRPPAAAAVRQCLVSRRRTRARRSSPAPDLAGLCLRHDVAGHVAPAARQEFLFRGADGQHRSCDVVPSRRRAGRLVALCSGQSLRVGRPRLQPGPDLHPLRPPDRLGGAGRIDPAAKRWIPACAGMTIGIWRTEGGSKNYGAPVAAPLAVASWVVSWPLTASKASLASPGSGVASQWLAVQL